MAVYVPSLHPPREKRGRRSGKGRENANLVILFPYKLINWKCDFLYSSVPRFDQYQSKLSISWLWLSLKNIDSFIEMSDRLGIPGSELGFYLLCLKYIQGLCTETWEVRGREQWERYILLPHRVLKMLFEHTLARARKMLSYGSL